MKDAAQERKQALARYREAGMAIIGLCAPAAGHSHGGRPCANPGKVPGRRGWQKTAGRPMDDKLQAELEKHRGNLGYPIPPGKVALDADSREDFERLHAKLQEARLKFWCQKSGRGGHFILRSPASGDARNSVKRRLGGVTYDVRGIGGQLVVYPSVHAGGARYEWEIAPWELSADQLSLLPAEYVIDQAPTPPAAVAVEDDAGPIEEGRRNDVLFRLGCSMRAKGAGEAAIWAALQARNAARCSPPLAAEEVRQIAASAARYEPGVSETTKLEPPVDVKAELAAFREKWQAAAEEQARDELLSGVLAAIMRSSVLERERAMDELQELTGHSRQLLNKVLSEQAKRAAAAVQEENKRQRRAMRETESPLPRVDYVALEPVNKFYDKLLGLMLPTGRFYNHHGSLVYVRPGHGLILMTESNLPGLLSSVAEIAVTEVGAEGPEFKGYDVLKRDLAAAFLHSPRMLAKFSVLNQYTRSPVVGLDWRLIAEPGYHAAGGIYYDGPSIQPARGTGRLMTVLEGFRWKTLSDRVNYIGMLLTGITMPHWPGKHPMAAYNANKPGTGKSTCARVSGLILEGRTPVTLSFNPNDEEFEKHLATRVGLGDRVVLIDNAKKTAHVREVESAVLERSITDPVLNYRRLGANQAISRANDVIFSLTMNYTKMSRDLRRRSVPVNLFVEENVRDVKYPIPNLEAYVEGHRVELLCELAGMVTRRVEAGRIELETPARHSVSQVWAETIDAVLRLSDFHGFLDNFEESEHAFDADYQLLVEVCAAHKDQSALTASEWAALLADNILEARLKDKTGQPKPLRSQATIVGNLFNQYLDTPIELDSGKYLIACEEHGRGHPNTYRFKPLDEAREAGC